MVGRPNPAQEGCFHLDLDWMKSDKLQPVFLLALAAAALFFFQNVLMMGGRRRKRAAGFKGAWEEASQLGIQTDFHRFFAF